MKKILLILVTILISFNGFSQLRNSPLHVPDSTTNFNTNLAIGSVVIDDQTHKQWQITARAFGVDNLSTIAKVQMNATITSLPLSTVLINDENSLGNEIILNPALPATNGQFQSSPFFRLNGNYDSDGGAGVVSTDIETTFQTLVATSFGLITNFELIHRGNKVINHFHSSSGVTSTGFSVTDGASVSDLGFSGAGQLLWENSVSGNTFSVQIDIGTEPVIELLGSTFQTNISALPTTADRFINTPDKDGTIALLSDITAPNLSTVLSTGNTTSGQNIILSGNDILQVGTTSGNFLGYNSGVRLEAGNTSETLTLMADGKIDITAGGTGINMNDPVTIGGGLSNATLTVKGVSAGILFIESSTNDDLLDIDNNGLTIFNGDNISTADFNIKGLTSTNLFYTDASNDNIGIGTSTPDASALLDLASTTMGLSPPDMTTGQRNAIVSPKFGLIIYNITTGKLEGYKGDSTWKNLH